MISMENIENSTFFPMLCELISEKISLIDQQGHRIELLWKKLWDQWTPILPDYPRLQFDSGQFYKNNSYRIHFLNQFQDLLYQYYYYCRYLLESVFNEYFSSEAFFTTYSKEFRDETLVKTAQIGLGALMDLVSLQPIEISTIFLIIAKFGYFLKIRSLTIQTMKTRFEKFYYPINTPEMLEMIKILININYLKLDDEQTSINLNTHISVNPYFFKNDYPIEKFNTTLKPVLEWIQGIWQSLYNYRRLNLTPEVHTLFKERLESILSRSATQGIKASLELFSGLEQYFIWLEEKVIKK